VYDLPRHIRETAKIPDSQCDVLRLFSVLLSGPK
jgi:hypothetical protein